MMRNNRGRSIPNHQPTPTLYRNKLPYGMHGQALEAGNRILSSIPVAERNFKKLQQQNNPLAMFVLSRVHKKYNNEVNHYRVAVDDAEKKEGYRRQAKNRVTQLVGRGFIANRVLTELKIADFNPNFVDAILRDKVIRVPEAKAIAKKLSELESIDRRMAKDTKLRIQSMLAAPRSYVDKRQNITLYHNAAEFVDRQIELARFSRK